MALSIGDNFNYNGKKPNFSRDSFETLNDLKAFAETNIDDGHISYCSETKKHYIFNSKNSVDSLTGKWRELETEFSNKVDQSTLDKYVTDEELQNELSGIKYELPKATNTTLGGIKVGNGLSIDDTGILSTTKVSCNWTDIQDKPQINGHELGPNNSLDSLGIQPKGDYALNQDIPDISNLATKTELGNKQDLLVDGVNIKKINGTSLLGEGNIVINSGGGSSEIIDVLDNKIYGRTQGSWVDLTDYLTWWEEKQN